MQTAFRTSQGWTGTADYSLSKFVPHPKGNLGTEKKDTSATGKHNAFLTGRITPLAPDYWHQDMDNDSPVNRKHSINSPFHSKNVILLL